MLIITFIEFSVPVKTPNSRTHFIKQLITKRPYSFNEENYIARKCEIYLAERAL